MKPKEVFEIKSQSEGKQESFTLLITQMKSAIDLFDVSSKNIPHMCSLYLEDYDEYIVYCCKESTKFKDPCLITIEMAIVSTDEVNPSIKKLEKKKIEITKSRFNLDFGLDFRLLMEDEKRFFISAYCGIIEVKKNENEEGNIEQNYSVSLGRFKVESTIQRSCGETYRKPLQFELLSDGYKPIAVVITTFDEIQVRKMGCVLGINPSKISFKK